MHLTFRPVFWHLPDRQQKIESRVWHVVASIQVHFQVADAVQALLHDRQATPLNQSEAAFMTLKKFSPFFDRFHT